MALSVIRQTDEARVQTCNPWFTRWEIYPLHHGGSSHISVPFRPHSIIWFQYYCLLGKMHEFHLIFNLLQKPCHKLGTQRPAVHVTQS